MKLLVSLSIACLAMLASACDKGTTSNPSTAKKEDLNPPVGLMTVTHHSAIELRWDAKNAEKDFKGYHVFMFAGTLADVGAPGYPNGASLTKNDEIPRCKLNSDVFKKFGFPDTTTDCTGGAEPTAADSTSSSLAGSSRLLDATTDTSTKTDPAITNIAICDENKTDKTISLTGTTPTLSLQTCTISKDVSGAALVDGTTYSFFVTAVKGDTNNEISWTSNFVSDTPSTPIFDTQGASGSTTFSVAGGNYYVFPVANLKKSTLAPITTAPTGTACVDFVCRINRFNSIASTSGPDGIYIGRRGSADASYPQRMFISVPSDGAITIQARGALTVDPKDKSFATSVPGDSATDTYDKSGTLYPVYGDQVFDIKVTDGGNTNYGKIVIGKLPEPATNADDIKLPITIIMQPKVGSTDYLTGNAIPQ